MASPYSWSFLTAVALALSPIIAFGQAPVITLDPVSQTVDAGATVVLSGASSDAGQLSYQWFHGTTALENGAGVTGATTASLTISNVNFARAGNYALHITSTGGTAISAEANLTVQRRPGGLAGSVQPEFNGDVHAIQILPDKSFLVGGAFSSVTIGGVTTNRGRLAHFFEDGSLDTSFSPGLNNTVYAIAMDSAGRVFVGGDFTSTNFGAAVGRVRVLRLTSSLALDTLFDTGTAGPDDRVFALAPVGNGSVYIGGEFEAIGSNVSTDVRAIALLKADGSVDGSFKSLATDNAYVRAILRTSNGSLYIGGSSNSWQTGTPFPFHPSGRLIKTSASGARIGAFNAVGNIPEGAGTIVQSLLLLKDGTLFAGLNRPGGYAERYNATNGTALGFTPNPGQPVAALAQQADGKVLLGGIFTTELGGQSGFANRLYRAAVNGTVDETFNLGTGFNNAVNAIAVDASGRILVGGSFTTLNGQDRRRFTILNGGAFESRNGLLPPQTITFGALPARTFIPGANTFTVSATASSSLPVSFAVSGPATISGNVVTITGAGEVTVTATQPGDDDFSAAPPVPQTFTVSKGSQNIQFASIPDRSALSPAFALSAASTSGLPVSFEVISGPATVNGSTLTLTGEIGTVVVEATQAGNATFNAATPVQQSFEAMSGPVLQVPQTISFVQPVNRFVNESPVLLEASTSSGLPVLFTVVSGPATVSGNTLTLTGAGKVTVKASQAGTANFLAAVDVTHTLTVLAPPAALTLTNLTQTYTGTPRPVGHVGAAAGSSVVITYAGSSTPPTNAGKYAVVAQAGSVKKTGTLVINKAVLTVTADSKRRLVNQANPGLTLSYSGFLGTDSSETIFNDPAAKPAVKAPVLTTTAKDSSPGGLYPIKAAGANAVNYSFIYVDGTMTVDGFAGNYEALLTGAVSGDPAAKIEITVAATSKTFSGKLSTPGELAAVPFKGDLTLDTGDEMVSAAITFTKGSNSYALNFALPLTGGFVANLNLNNAPFANTGIGQKLLVLAKGQVLTYVGAHTLVLSPGLPLSGTSPAGSGHATATIDAKGVLKLAGKLADGTAITASLSADAEAGYRAFIQPYKRLDSFVAGWISLINHPDLPGRKHVSFASETDWVWAKKAETKDKSYRLGIGPLMTRITLDPWLPPVTKPAVISLTDRLGVSPSGKIEVAHSAFDSSSYEGLPLEVTLDAKNAVNVTDLEADAANKWKVTFTPATGAFTGSFVVAGAKPLTVPFTGVLRQPPSTDTDGLIGAGNFQLPPAVPANETVSGEVLFKIPGLPE